MAEEFVIRSNKEIWLQEAKRQRCPRYQPCPICYKCMVKASHLYLKCQSCPIPICGHTEKERELMIRRENFSPKFEL